MGLAEPTAPDLWTCGLDNFLRHPRLCFASRRIARTSEALPLCWLPQGRVPGVSQPAPTPDHGKADKPDAKQRDRPRLWYEFSDYNLAVAGLEIGDQDLVCARIEGAAAATGTIGARADKAPAAAEATAKRASCEIRECTAARRPDGATAGAEKAATATTAAHTPAAAYAAGA